MEARSDAGFRVFGGGGLGRESEGCSEETEGFEEEEGIKALGIKASRGESVGAGVLGGG
jgi:hypothetical protein